MLADKLERQFLITYLNHVCKDASLLKMFQSTPDVMLIVKGYLAWLDDK